MVKEAPELRPYQIEDIAKLIQKPTMACFNEQRTGKTPTALKTLELSCKKILIVCPASIVMAWKEEFETWLERPCLAVLGTPQKRKEIINKWTDGLVISYDTFKSTERTDGEVDLILSKKPDGMILDECHKIKNPKSAVAKAIFKTIEIPRRLALSATPAPNKPYEIFSILHWLYPNTFNSYWKFIGDYFKTLRTSARGHTFIDIQGFKPGMQAKLQAILNSISTQRKRKEVMQWLPDKDYQKVKLDITPEQKKYLDELESYYETENIVTKGTLDRLTRFRQICVAPELLKLKGKSPKTEWIKQYLTDYPEKSVIIFSKFTSYLKLLEKELQPGSFYTIIGATPSLERNNIKHSFQNGERKVLLANIDACKEGLTLDTAEVVIFVDIYPPMADILQAEDRFVATTEERANKAHTIIQLMMKGTYDERLYSLIQKRISQTDVINDYKKYLTERGK